MTNRLGLLCAAILLSVQVSFATVYTWTGNSSTFWNNSNNWSPAGIPANGDIAQINNGLCQIPHGYHAHADRVEVGTNGELIIRRNGRLYLHSVSAISLFITGDITNKGRIYSHPTSTLPAYNVSIEPGGHFEQTSTGKLYLSNATIGGIRVWGTFVNNGRIEYDAFYQGNSGLVILDDGVFQNGSTAWVFLDNVLQNAIAVLNTTNLSENAGKIYIDSPVSTVGIFLQNGQFKNTDYILSEVSSGKNLKVDAASSFINAGEMNMIGGDLGVLVQGDFINEIEGELLIQHVDDDGLEVGLAGSFTNFGLLTTFGTIPGNAIRNFNDFTNAGRVQVSSTPVSGISQVYTNGELLNDVCAEFYHSGSLYIDASGEVINKGFWTTMTSNSTGGLGVFLNPGVLADPYGAFLYFTSLYNEGHYIPPVQGPFCIDEIVQDILLVGNSPSYESKYWYTDGKYNILAGEYDYGTNDLYITPDAGGLALLYAEFNYGNDCSHRVPVGFDPPIQEGIEICGDGIDNDCDGQIDESSCTLAPMQSADNPLTERDAPEQTGAAPVLSPNPSPNGNLLIHWENVPDHQSQIEIFQTDGRLIWTGTGNNIQTGLPAGMYFVRITSPGHTYPVQKWIIR